MVLSPPRNGLGTQALSLVLTNYNEQPGFASRAVPTVTLLADLNCAKSSVAICRLPLLPSISPIRNLASPPLQAPKILRQLRSTYPTRKICASWLSRGSSRLVSTSKAFPAQLAARKWLKPISRRRRSTSCSLSRLTSVRKPSSIVGRAKRLTSRRSVPVCKFLSIVLKFLCVPETRLSSSEARVPVGTCFP